MGARCLPTLPRSPAVNCAGPGITGSPSDHYHHHYHHQTHPRSNLLLEVKYSYWSVKLLHMQIFSLWSPAMEKIDKIADIPEWYPRLSLMSWMRDNRILTVNQQEAISSDLLVRGQPFPSKNLVNATRLGHSWLTQLLSRNAEDIDSFLSIMGFVKHYWLGLLQTRFAQGMLSSLILNHANLNFGAFRHHSQHWTHWRLCKLSLWWRSSV